MRTKAAPRLLPFIPALLAPVAVAAAGVVPHPAVLPIAATLAAWPAMATLLVRGRRAAAVGAVLGWAAALSFTTIVWTAADPGGAGPLVLNGPAYRDQMFAFIRTGSGAESDPARFIPLHLRHLAIFVLLALPTGGLLAIGMGAALVGYMSFYVGALASACPGSMLPWVAGWPPWALARVAAFVLLGVVLAEPILALGARWAGRGVAGAGGVFLDASGAAFARRGAGLAAALLLVDLVLKGWLAPAWAVLLRGCLTAP